MVLGNTGTNRNIYETFISHYLCSKILNSCFCPWPKCFLISQEVKLLLLLLIELVKISFPRLKSSLSFYKSYFKDIY